MLHPTGAPETISSPKPVRNDVLPWRKMGHPTGRFVERLPIWLPDRPCAGDVVRLVAPGWSWGMVQKSCKLGSLGMISGEYGKPRDQADITFSFSAHVDKYVTCSGGPGTVWTDMSKLKAANEIAVVTCWRWRDGISGAGRGVDFEREARIWDWDGSD